MDIPHILSLQQLFITFDSLIVLSSKISLMKFSFVHLPHVFRYMTFIIPIKDPAPYEICNKKKKNGRKTNILKRNVFIENKIANAKYKARIPIRTYAKS